MGECGAWACGGSGDERRRCGRERAPAWLELLRACTAQACAPPFTLPPSPPGVETVFDLMEMEDDARRELLQVGGSSLGSWRCGGK